MLQQYIATFFTDVDVKKAGGAIHIICDASTIPNTGNISHSWQANLTHMKCFAWGKVPHILARFRANLTVDE